jgi:hypothetical protein
VNCWGRGKSKKSLLFCDKAEVKQRRNCGSFLKSKEKERNKNAWSMMSLFFHHFVLIFSRI